MSRTGAFTVYHSCKSLQVLSGAVESDSTSKRARMAYLYQEETLTVNADSTEFCQLETLQHVLAVGTYELDEKTRSRHGLLHLYHLKQAPVDCKDPTAGTCLVPQWQMQLAQTSPISGIFDMKWRPVQPACLLAACADGSLHVLRVHHNDAVCHSSRQQAVQVSDKGMAVSLDITSSGQQVASSSSDGSLSTLQVLFIFPVHMQMSGVAWSTTIKSSPCDVSRQPAAAAQSN